MARPADARIRGHEVWLRGLEGSDLPAHERAFESPGFCVDGTSHHHFRRAGKWRDSGAQAV